MAEFVKPNNDTPTLIMTNPLTLSYVHLYEPYTYDESQEPKYSATLLIDKTDTETINLINTAVDNAKKVGQKNKWGGRIPTSCRNPLMDGDDKAATHPEFAGKYYLNAKADIAHRPAVTDRDGILIPDDRSSEVYSGCKAVAFIDFYPYSWNGATYGVGVSLRGIAKFSDGTPLGGSGTLTPTVMGEFLSDIAPEEDPENDPFN